MRVADDDEGRKGRVVALVGGTRTTSSTVDRPQRLLRSDGRWPYGCWPYSSSREDTLGHRRRHVPHLHEAVEPLIAHAFELPGLEPRTRHDVREELERRVGEAPERRQPEHRRVGANLGLEVRTDAAQRFVQLERAAGAAPFVQHVARDRRDTGTAYGVVAGADRQDDERIHDRDVAVLDCPHAQPVRQRSASDVGEGEGRFGTEGGQARCDRQASGHHHRFGAMQRELLPSSRDDAQ